MAKRYFTLLLGLLLLMSGVMAMAQDTCADCGPQYNGQGGPYPDGNQTPPPAPGTAGGCLYYCVAPYDVPTISSSVSQNSLPFVDSPTPFRAQPDPGLVMGSMMQFVTSALQAGWNRVDSFLNGPREVEIPEHSGHYYPVVNQVMPLGPPGFDAEDVILEMEKEIPQGSFSITDWSGYPKDLPRPEGTPRLLTGAEYEDAREAANSANTAIRKLGVPPNSQIHEILPVKFGGDPFSSGNKMVLPAQAHYEVTNWWTQLQRYLTWKP